MHLVSLKIAGLRQDVQRAAAATEKNPSEAQKAYGNYAKGSISLHGLPISIENPKGSTRKGDGWENVVKNHYGYIKGTEGKDGDHVDVFIGPAPESELVVVINQVNPKTRAFDEHKVMLGFTNEQEAKDAYLSNYEKGWRGLGSAHTMSVQDFKTWLNERSQKRPITKTAMERYFTEGDLIRAGRRQSVRERNAQLRRQEKMMNTGANIGTLVPLGLYGALKLKANALGHNLRLNTFQASHHENMANINKMTGAFRLSAAKRTARSDRRYIPSDLEHLHNLKNEVAHHQIQAHRLKTILEQDGPSIGKNIKRLNRGANALALSAIPLGLLGAYAGHKLGEPKNNTQKTASSDDRQRVGPSIGGAAGGLMLGGLAALPVSGPAMMAGARLTHSLREQEVGPNGPNARAKDFLRKRYGSGVTFVDAPTPPLYMPKYKVVAGTQGYKPELLSHELGHASTHRQLGKTYERGTNLIRNGVNYTIPLGASAYMYYRKSDPDKANRMLNTATAAGTAGHALILADEGAASMKGMKMLREANRMGHNINLGAARKNLLKTFGSYGLMAASPIAAHAVIKKLFPTGQKLTSE